MQLQSLADIARLVKTQRLKLGLSQYDAADRAGVSRQLLGRIERGIGGTSIDTFLKIASALGITLEGQAQQAQAESPVNLSGLVDPLERWLLTDPTKSEPSNG